jgi:hypothetical protein
VSGASGNWIWVLVRWLAGSGLRRMASRSKGVEAPGAVPPMWQPVTGTAPTRRLVNGSKTGALHHRNGTAPLLYCYCGDRQARGSVRTAGRLLRLRQHWVLLLLLYSWPVASAQWPPGLPGTVRDLIPPSPHFA